MSISNNNGNGTPQDQSTSSTKKYIAFLGVAEVDTNNTVNITKFALNNQNITNDGDLDTINNIKNKIDGDLKQGNEISTQVQEQLSKIMTGGKKRSKKTRKSRKSKKAH